MYTALYVPCLSDDETDPSKEFPTETEAWNYIFDSMCRECQAERKLYFAMQANGEDPDKYDENMPESRASEYPACSAEWLVVDSDELKKCETFDDFLMAGGFGDPIYTRPESNNNG